MLRKLLKAIAPATRARAHHFPRRAVAEACEPRVLYSADLNPMLWAAGAASAELRVLDAAAPTAAAPAATNTAARHELIFVDAGVADAQRLVDALLAARNSNTVNDAASHAAAPAQLEVIQLDANRDGMAQITEVLAAERDISAIHIISHGDAGRLQLGNAMVDARSLRQHAADLQTWRQSLTAGADILLYGCDVAQGEVGDQFIHLLAQLSGTDVAASTDATGSAALGGNWLLEDRVGQIEALVAADDAALQSWNGLLDITTGLKGRWTFDTNATDSSGNGYNGTLTNGALIDTAPTTIQVGPGKLFLDGSNDYVNLSTHQASFASLTQGSVSAWIKTSDAQGAIFALSDVADTTSYAVLGVLGGKLSFQVYENNVGYLNVASTAAVNDNAWHHVAVTVGASGNKLYIDGVLQGVTYSVGSAAITSFFNTVTGVDTLMVGANQTSAGLGSFLAGLVDDVRIYDRALSTADVAQLAVDHTLYTQQLTGGGVAFDVKGMRNASGFSGGTLTPTLTIAGVPAGAIIVKAWLYVSELSPGTIDTSFTLNGSGVTATAVSSSADPGWGVTAVVTVKADVTAIVTAAPNGNYVLGGADALGSDQYEGAVLVVVYSDGSSALQNIVTVSDKSHSILDTNNSFSAKFNSGSSFPLATTAASVYLATFDGQSNYGEAALKFQASTAATATTIVAANSFTGSNGGGTKSVVNISALISKGDTGATLSQVTTGSDDYLVYPFWASVVTLAAPPVNTVPSAQAATEDTAKVFSSANGNAISISDADAGGANNQTTLSVTNGTLTLAGTAGLTTVVGNGTASILVRGTASAINTALNGLVFNPTLNYNGAAQLSVDTQDSTLLSLNTDSNLLGLYLFDNAALLGDDSSPVGAHAGTPVGVTAVYDATRGDVLSMAGAGYIQTPGLYANPANITLAAWVNLTAADTSGAEVLSIGDNVLLRLDDAGRLLGGVYNGTSFVSATAAVTLAGTGWHHVAFSFNDTGNVGTLYLDGSVVASTSTTASVVYNQGTNSFIGKHGNGQTGYGFNGRIDDARVYNRALTANEIATMATDQSLVVSSSVAINIAAVNDAPIATNLSAAEAYTEDTALNLVDIVVSDVDNANLTATLTLSNVSAGALNTGTSGAVTSTFNAGTGTWTASGAIADVNALLAALTFTPTLNFNANFSIATHVSDGSLSVAGSKAFTGTAVNDAPTATNLNAAEAYTEDLALNLTDIVVNDVDSANLTATLTLSNSAAGALNTGSSGAVTSTFNTGTGVWTATGAIADVNVLLAALTFTPTLNFNANFSIATHVSDGLLSVTGSKSFTGTAVNDAPLLTATATTLAYTENDPAKAVDPGLNVSDIDSANLVSATVSVSANFATGQDVLAFTDQSGITGTWNAGTGVLSLNGSATVAQYQTALRSVTYLNSSDNPNSVTRTVSFVVNDAALNSNTASRNVSVTAVNDAPTATNLNAAETYTEDTALNLIDIVIIDVDSASVTATLTLSNVSAGSLTTGTSGAVTSAYNAGTGVWSASGALADVNALLAALTFTPSLNFNANFAVATSVSDGVATITGSKALTGIAVNDAPVLLTNVATLAYNENAAATLVDASLTVSDVDSSNLTSATVSITTAYSVSQDVLAFTTQNGITGVWNSAAGVLSLSGSATVAQYQAALRSVTYVNTSDNPNTTTRSVSFVVNDGTVESGTGTRNISVAAVNDAPVITVPGAQNTSQNAALVFSVANRNAISVADLDAGAAALQVTLTATSGTLTLSGTAGLSFSSGANGSATMVFSGSVTSINTALNGLSFAPTTGYTGSATLQISSNDLGNSGSGGALSDTAVVTIGISSSSLWVSTQGASATSSPGSGGLTWTDGQVVNFGNPNLSLGAGTTSGTFSSVFDLDTFSASNANVTGLHYVKTAVTVGTVNSVALLAGDVLLTVDANETLGGVAVTKKDIVLFRPTTLGNYAGGTFSVLIRDPGATGNALYDFALVEQPITVGGTSLQAGDFLLGISGATYDNDILLFRPTTLSTSPTGGALTLLIDGSSSGINWGGGNRVYALELVNTATTIGGQTLNAGTVLVSLSGSGTAGSNALAVGAGDVFALSVASTGFGTSSATASMLLRSANVGLTSSAERFDAIALVSSASQAPVLTLPGGALNYTENAAATLVDATATVADADSANFDNGILIAEFTVNGTADDRLGIRTEGAAIGQIGVTGANITYNFGAGAVVVGVFSGGTDGSTPLIVNFNANATPLAAQALLRNITYANVSEAPSTAARTVSFVLTDGRGGTSSAATKTMVVTAVNDAPVATNLSAAESYVEDTALNLSAIVISDVDSANVTATLTLSNIAAGSLNTGSSSSGSVTSTYNAGTGVWTASGALADVNALLAALTFTPTLNFSSNFSIATSVSDGVAAPITGSKSFTATAVNDAPTVITSGQALAYTENDAATAVDPGITVNDVDSANLSSASVTITTAYAAAEDVLAFTTQNGITGVWDSGTGALTLSGAATVAQYQAALRSVTYVNSADNPSTATRTVRFIVGDGALDSSPATRSIRVQPVNDAPVITSNGAGATAAIGILENSSAVSTVTSTDVDGGAAVYSISGGADAAKFTINASTGVLSFITPPDFESPSDVGANNVYDLTVQVSDGSLTDTQDIAVTVSAVNDNAPVITSNGGGPTAALNVAENSTAVTTITATDADLPAPTLTYTLIGGADAARFTVNTATGALSFVAPPNFEAPTDVGADNVYDVTVQVSDGTLTNSQAVAVTVTNVNEAPSGTNTTVSTTENFAYVFSAANFGFIDVDAGDGLSAVRIDTLPLAGSLTLSGLAVNAGDVISAAQLAAGNLVFSPAPAASGIAYGSFNFSVRDQGNAFDAISKTLTVDVGAVNDAPVITTSGSNLSYTENATATAVDAGLAVSDIDSASLASATVSLSVGFSPGEDTLAFTDQNGITGVWNAGAGVLTLSGSATVTQYQAALRSITYVNGSDNPSTAARTLSFVVNDGAANSNVGTRNISITAVNDAPLISSNGGGATAAVVTAESLRAVATVTSSDVDGGTPVYSISGGADAARFTINASTGVLSFITAPDFETPTDAGADNVYDLIVQVSDGSLTDTQAIAVTVTNVNEAPSGSNVTLSTPEDTALSFSAANFGFTDVDADDSLSAIRIDTLPLAGGLTLSGAAVNAGDLVSAAQLAAGRLVFTPAPNANGTAYASLSFSVRDQGNLFDATPRTLTVNVGAVNDAPVLTQNQLALAEGASAVITAANLAATDTDNADAALVFTVTGVQHGRFEYVAAPGAAITRFTQAEVGGAQVRFVHDGGELATAYSVSVSDGSLSTAPAAASVAFSQVNDAPTTAPVTLNSIAEDSGPRLITQAELLAHAADVDSVNLLALNLSISSGNGVLVSHGNGTWTFTAALNDDSAVSFSYLVSDGSLSVAASATVDITPVNDAPAFSALPASISVAENTTAVTTVSATDVDSATASLTYSISGGADAARFTIDATTGVLRFLNAPNFEQPDDADGDHIYELSLQVSDGAGGTQAVAQQALRVSVLDLNEAPVLSSAMVATLSGTATPGTWVATATAVDPDAAEALQFALLADANGRFAIDAASGQITVAAGAVFDANAAASYDLLVRVTDKVGLSFQHTLRVNVDAAVQPKLNAVSAGATTSPGAVGDADASLISPKPVEAVAPSDAASDRLKLKPVAIDKQSGNPETGSEGLANDARRNQQNDSGGSDVRLVSVERPRRAGEAGEVTANLLPSPKALLLALLQFDAAAPTLSAPLQDAMDANQSDAAVNLTRNSLGYGLRRGDQVAAQSDGEATADGNARAASSSLSLDQVFSASRVASVSFSAGFIWWLTRGGGLLTSMLMGVPAWRHIDLLPVLARNFDDEDQADGDGDGDEGKPLPKTAAHRTDGTNQAATKAAREAAATADIKVEALFEPRSAARPTLHRTPE